MKNYLKFITYSLFLHFFLSCNYIKSDKNEKSATYKANYSIDNIKVADSGLSLSKVILKTSHGNITIKTYPKVAPNTVTRFLSLVNDGFYDGLVFHRVISGFVIQAGDPTGTGKGGSGKKIKAEFSDLQHILGTVAMARSPSDIDSADSQFYITLGTQPFLDGKYTIFGQVVEGLEILPKISKGDRILSMEYIE